MKVAAFTNGLGLGGTEKAACLWAIGLQRRGYSVVFLTLEDGPRRHSLEKQNIEVHVLEKEVNSILKALHSEKPDVIHAHAPGYSHGGDVLGSALIEYGQKIPVVQTNVFGRLENPKENAWVDFRLFVSWTSAVQAARRSFKKLDREFFRKNSVASNPLDLDGSPNLDEVAKFRAKLGLEVNDVLFGRFSRPDPNKWLDLPIHGFQLALNRCRNLKLLLREPPQEVANWLKSLPESDRFIILPITSDAAELSLTQMSVDAVLHTSSIGESFGYGIAEPMIYGKPVIANSVPWQDQAQIELVKPGKGGFISSTPKTVAQAISQLAESKDLRVQMGDFARTHIQQLANVEVSLDRLEMALRAVVMNQDNPVIDADLLKAKTVASQLDHYQFGSSIEERLKLQTFYYKQRFSQWRCHLRGNFK